MLPFHILARKALIVGIGQAWPFLFATVGEVVAVPNELGPAAALFVECKIAYLDYKSCCLHWNPGQNTQSHNYFHILHLITCRIEQWKEN
jgi:hypothetical protein